jgi:hypothetical protein
MVAKVYADRLNLDAPSSAEGVLAPAVSMVPDVVPEGPLEGFTSRELEAEVQAVAAWFEALPAEWRSYFDREAESGRRAYGQA